LYFSGDWYFQLKKSGFVIWTCNLQGTRFTLPIVALAFKGVL